MKCWYALFAMATLLRWLAGSAPGHTARCDGKPIGLRRPADPSPACYTGRTTTCRHFAGGRRRPTGSWSATIQGMQLKSNVGIPTDAGYWHREVRAAGTSFRVMLPGARSL